jgi:hypothetical protein
MIPHERSLVQKMEGKPFVLIGVNSDRDPAQLKKDLKDNKVTWRSFRNSKKEGGAISNDWGVRGWPTLYVIDHKGVVKEQWVGSPGGEVLDKAIEKLVKVAQADLGKEGASGAGEKAGSSTPKPPPPPPPPADPEKAAAGKLKLAQQLIDDGLNDKARKRLEGIIKDYPKTKAATQAKVLLDKLPQQ